MGSQNRYCCRCRRTTRFAVELADPARATFTCGGCGVEVTVPRQRVGLPQADSSGSKGGR